MGTLLEINGLKKYFPIRSKKLFYRTVEYVKAVDNVSFTIEEGETLGLVGESGCGKSTTGRSAIRLIEPTEGEIIFGNKNLCQLSTRDCGKPGRICRLFSGPLRFVKSPQNHRRNSGRAINHSWGPKPERKKGG